MIRNETWRAGELHRVEEIDIDLMTYTLTVDGVEVESRALTAEEAEPYQRSRDEISISSYLRTAIGNLRTIRDAPSLTNQQAVDAIQEEAAILIKIIRFLYKDYSGVD